MFKFALGQEIFFLMHNNVRSSKIHSRIFVDNTPETPESMRSATFQDTRVEYATCIGICSEEEAFATKEELLKSL